MKKTFVALIVLGLVAACHNRQKPKIAIGPGLTPQAAASQKFSFEHLEKVKAEVIIASMDKWHQIIRGNYGSPKLSDSFKTFSVVDDKAGDDLKIVVSVGFANGKTESFTVVVRQDPSVTGFGKAERKNIDGLTKTKNTTPIGFRMVCLDSLCYDRLMVFRKGNDVAGALSRKYIATGVPSDGDKMGILDRTKEELVVAYLNYLVGSREIHSSLVLQVDGGFQSGAGEVVLTDYSGENSTRLLFSDEENDWEMTLRLKKSLKMRTGKIMVIDPARHKRQRGYLEVTLDENSQN